MLAFEEYLKKISFKHVRPDTPLAGRLPQAVLLSLCARAGFNFEVLNTRLPETDPNVAAALKSLCKIPKASTFALGAIINRAVATMPDDQVFLNIGVWHGFTFLSGLVCNAGKTCIGVDNFSVSRKVKGDGTPEYQGVRKAFYEKVDSWARGSFLERFERHKSEKHFFHEMDYVEYFEKVHQEPIGFYIYDAQHRYRDQRRALELAEPFLAKDCLVFIDDTNAPDNRQATLDFIRASRFKYRMLMDERTYANRHPTLWNGLMVFQKSD